MVWKRLTDKVKEEAPKMRHTRGYPDRVVGPSVRTRGGQTPKGERPGRETDPNDNKQEK